MREDLPGEQWLGLVAYPGYDISSQGRARSYRKKSPRPSMLDTPHLLTPTKSHDGYPMFTVRVNKKKFWRPAHRLVLEAFVGLCPEGMVCRHLDGNPANNCVENLCWGTPKENLEDAKRHGTYACSRVKLTEEKVQKILRLRGTGRTRLEISQMFGVCERTITQIVGRKSWTHVSA